LFASKFLSLSTLLLQVAALAAVLLTVSELLTDAVLQILAELLTLAVQPTLAAVLVADAALEADCVVWVLEFVACLQVADADQTIAAKLQTIAVAKLLQ
jgi:hypothetical protein